MEHIRTSAIVVVAAATSCWRTWIGACCASAVHGHRDAQCIGYVLWESTPILSVTAGSRQCRMQRNCTRLFESSLQCFTELYLTAVQFH
jgi:hypothetical protein